MSAIISDAEIQILIAESKNVPQGLLPLQRFVEINRYRRKDFEVQGENGNSFTNFTRQNTLNLLDFSAILGYQVPGVNTIFRLRRYNGKHWHTNPLEGERIYDFHMHTATERYQRLGGREDHFATLEKRYTSLDGAVRCLLADCGFRSDIESSPLFTGLVQ